MQDSELEKKLESYSDKSSKKTYIWLLIIFILIGSAGYYYFIIKNKNFLSNKYKKITKKI